MGVSFGSTEIRESNVRGSASDYHYYSGKQRELGGRDAAKYASHTRPRLQTRCPLQGTAGQGQGSGAPKATALLCEECGDGELAADATSPVVHQACTAMSRERPEAALRSYGHFSRRRANDQHAHATFSNHNPASYTMVPLQGLFGPASGLGAISQLGLPVFRSQAEVFPNAQFRSP